MKLTKDTYVPGVMFLFSFPFVAMGLLGSSNLVP